VGVLHDAVVAAAGPGAAGAGAVPEQHLRGGLAVQLHQVALCPAAVQPRPGDLSGLRAAAVRPTRRTVRAPPTRCLHRRGRSAAFVALSPGRRIHHVTAAAGRTGRARGSAGRDVRPEVLA
jgi:hypothetical protein